MAIATTFRRIVRIRSGTFWEKPPTAASARFISRVNTRVPSPNKLLSVGW